MTVIEFPAPTGLMSLNDRSHWAVKARNARTWRYAAKCAAQAALPPGMREHPRCLVTITLPVVRLGTRRDPSNFTATSKHAIDGLVDAGIWRDDTPEYVVENVIRFRQGGNVTIELTPIPADAA